MSLQLGRSPRGPWGVAAKCSHGSPTVIAVSPRLEDGGPFPTAFWLTCPWLVAAVSDLESAGAPARWTAALEASEPLAKAALRSDLAYREARAALGAGDDPCAGVGIAGQSDPLAVKCVHARVAVVLAGLSDPVGEGALGELESGGVAVACPDARCRMFGGAGRTS